MPDEPTTQELRLDQIRRERNAKADARAAVTPEEAHTAERRADKAAYLKEKLEDQAEALED